MTDISQSHGTLNSVTTDSSTPSNNSQYFSVASSLGELNDEDEVYYSMGDGIDKDMTIKDFNHIRKYECHKIIPENDTVNDDILSTTLSSYGEIVPEIFIHECSVDVEDWDKVCDSLNSFISQESVSTDEDEDLNNYSAVTDSVINYSNIDQRNADSDENISISASNSVIDGELSELCDIVYESFDSPDNVINDTEKDQNPEEKDDELNEENNAAIFKMADDIEFRDTEVPMVSDYIELCENDVTMIPKCTETPIIERNSNNIEISNQNSVDQSSETLHTEVNSKNEKSLQIIDDSPIKRSSLLCCSVKRKKVKYNSEKKPSNRKSLFSFLLFFKTKPVEVIVQRHTAEQTVHNVINSDICHATVTAEEQSDIPYIDDDGEIYKDSDFPLAKQEIFWE